MHQKLHYISRLVAQKNEMPALFFLIGVGRGVRGVGVEIFDPAHALCTGLCCHATKCLCDFDINYGNITDIK